MCASSHTSIYPQLTSIAPTTFSAVEMDGTQGCSVPCIFTYATNLTSHNFYHTLDCSLEFPPYFIVITCVTLVQIQLFHVKTRKQILVLQSISGRGYYSG